jgi:cytochrome c-type biogenesis protein
MILFFGSFVAGLLTVLAPCILPLLPVIIGGSIGGKNASFRRPLLITLSLATSLFLFTLLLKATTLLIDVPPAFFTALSGGIVAVLGVLMLFPRLYQRVTMRLGFE